MVTTVDDCIASGGDYLGQGTTCEPDPCDCIRYGACCLEADCIFVTAHECLLAGGWYQGDNTNCDPNPCDPVPTIESSWGGVKSNYR